jgi:hypothetical protein
MKTSLKPKTKEMRAEYDFSASVRGRHFNEYSLGTNVVLLTKENAKHFPTPDAVNSALAAFRLLGQSDQHKVQSVAR